MVVDWTNYFICSKCNTSKKVVKVLEEGVDHDTNLSFRKIEMDCGHTEKTFRITKSLTLAWEIKKGENFRVEPVVTDGTPSVAVSGGSHTTVIAGAVNLEGVKDSTINVNYIAVQAKGNSNVQNLFETHVNITYNEILKEIPDESERQEIKNILEEIMNNLNSKQIPNSGLLQKLETKLKRYEKVYNLVLPVVLKGIDFVKFFYT